MQDFQIDQVLLHANDKAQWSPAADEAVWLAMEMNATICVVDVIDDQSIASLDFFPPSKLARLMEARREQLAELTKQILRRGVRATHALLQGRPVVELVNEIRARQFDIFIRDASGGKPLPGLHFDAIDMRLLRNCPCPLWLAAPKAKPPRKIVAAIDALDEDPRQRQLNKRVLRLAATLADLENAELHLITAWRMPGESLLLGRIQEELMAEQEAAVSETCAKNLRKLLARLDLMLADQRICIRKGDPELEILRRVDELHADLLVMGSVARTGITGFLIGNTAESVSRRARCSILTVKPKEFVSPLENNN